MFRKNNKAFAYQWSGPSSTWVEIGEVTGVVYILCTVDTYDTCNYMYVLYVCVCVCVLWACLWMSGVWGLGDQV